MPISEYPFKHAGPVSAVRMIDRAAELRRLGQAAGEQTPVRLAAPRRYGKTTLLAAHAETLTEVGWRCVRADLGGVTDQPGVARALLAAWAPHRDADAVRRVQRLAGRIGFDVSLAGPRVQLAPAATARPPETSRLLEELLDLPEQLSADVDAPVLVVFDEFQDLLVAGPNLDARVRAVIQHHKRTAYVFAGSEPSMLARMFERHEAPFFGQAEPLGLQPLPIEETIDEVERRFKELELRPGGAAAGLVELAQGHPQRTMFLCHLLARRLGDGIEASDDEHVDAVAGEALELTSEIHAAALAPLSRTQRVVLGEIAHGRPPTARDLADRQGATRAAYQKAAESLLATGQLLSRDPDGRWRIIDPLLRVRLSR